MGRNVRGSLLLPFLLVLVLTGWPLHAQLEPGKKIVGTVRVADGKLADARIRVRLYNSSRVMVDEQYADSSGRFIFGGVGEGNYEVEAALPGYEAGRQSVIVMPIAGFRATILLTLQPARAGGGAMPAVPTVDASLPPKARQHWQKAQEELAANHADRARKQCELAIKEFPFAAAFRMLASIALDEGKLDEADLATRGAIELQPKDAEAAALRGAVLNRGDRFADALPLLEQAVAENPALWRGQFELGQTLVAMKRNDDALPHAEQALALRGDSFAEGHVLLANVLMNLRKYPQAAEHLARFLKLAPNSPSAAPAREVLKKMKAAGISVPD